MIASSSFSNAVVTKQGSLFTWGSWGLGLGHGRRVKNSAPVYIDKATFEASPIIMAACGFSGSITLTKTGGCGHVEKNSMWERMLTTICITVYQHSIFMTRKSSWWQVVITICCPSILRACCGHGATTVMANCVAVHSTKGRVKRNLCWYRLQPLTDRKGRIWRQVVNQQWWWQQTAFYGCVALETAGNWGQGHMKTLWYLRGWVDLTDLAERGWER